MSKSCSNDEQDDIDLEVLLNRSNSSRDGSRENACAVNSSRDPGHSSSKQILFVAGNYSSGSGKCGRRNQLKGKPAWNSGSSKSRSEPLIVCKDCGCAFKESQDRCLDEKKLQLVEIHENPQIDSCDIVFSVNLKSVAEYQWQGTSKVPCDCQRCRKCRRKAPGDHYPDCECTLCQKRTAKCLNKEYYKLKYYTKCDARNARNEGNPEGYARVCDPEERPGIRCDCHDSVRILNAVHGLKCTCSKCMKFRRNYRRCCTMYAQTIERRKAKQNENLSVSDEDEENHDRQCYKTLSELFPTVPQSCGHGPLCICPSQYKAAAANITTYCRDETKPCLCHSYAPSNWDRVGPCHFQLCDQDMPRKKSVPVWDTTRESIDIEDSPSFGSSGLRDTQSKVHSEPEAKSKPKPSDTSKRTNERKPSRETLSSLTFSLKPSNTSIAKAKEKENIKPAIKSWAPTNPNFQLVVTPARPQQEQKRKSSMTPSTSEKKDKEVSREQKKRSSIASSTNSKEPSKQDGEKRTSLTPSTGKKYSKEEKKPSRTPSIGSKASGEVVPKNATASNAKPNLESKKQKDEKDGYYFI